MTLRLTLILAMMCLSGCVSVGSYKRDTAIHNKNVEVVEVEFQAIKNRIEALESRERKPYNGVSQELGLGTTLYIKP